MIHHITHFLVLILIQLFSSRAIAAPQPLCISCQLDAENKLICLPNAVMTCHTIKAVPKDLDFKQKRPSKSYAKSARSDASSKSLARGGGGGLIEKDLNPQPISTTNYNWDILDPLPYTSLLPEWYKSLSSQPSKDGPFPTTLRTGDYLDRIHQQNLAALNGNLQDLSTQAQEISDQFDSDSGLGAIASATAASENNAAIILAAYINSEYARSESLQNDLQIAISEYNHRFVENNPVDRHAQDVQRLADQLNREVAQDVEERQARQQTNQELTAPLKDPFKTFSDSREGKAIRRADSYLVWTREETSKQSGDGRIAADKLLIEAQHTLAAADQFYAEGSGTQAEFALRLTYQIADAALSLAPLAVIALAPEALSVLAVVSAIDIAKNYYEFRTGRRLFGGDELTPMERHFAGAGTILGMLPASGIILGRIGDFVQEVRQLKSVAKFGLAGREVVAAEEAADGVQGIFNSAGEVGQKLIRGSEHIDWKIADRVTDQLKDARMGELAGKISPEQLVEYANSKNAKRFIDVRPDPASGLPKNNINILQEIEGKTIRITTPNNEFKIISVGPIQKRNIRNNIDKGDFIPISKFDGWE